MNFLGVFLFDCYKIHVSQVDGGLVRREGGLVRREGVALSEERVWLDQKSGYDFGPVLLFCVCRWIAPC